MKLPFVAVLLAVGMAAAAPAAAQFSPGDDGEWNPPGDHPYDDPSDAAPGPGEYDDALGPYGTWQDDPGYGRFWRPRVAAGWQPYLDGQWVWTSYGWTWVSREPWSWVFHYGRWSYLPSWGWSWFPGSVWGPAWVNWASHGGYVGWAPLSPWSRPRYQDYFFVRDHDFCAPHLRGRVFRYDRVPRGVLEHWRDHEGRRPERHDIERVSRHPIRVLPDRPERSVAPWQRARGRRPAGDGRQEDHLVHQRERDAPRGDPRPHAEHPPRSDGVVAPPAPHAREPRWPGEQRERPRAHTDDMEHRRPAPQPRDGARVERRAPAGLRGERGPRLDRAERPSFVRPRVERAPSVREQRSPSYDGARAPLVRSPRELGGAVVPVPRGAARSGGDGRAPLVHRGGAGAGGGRGAGAGAGGFSLTR